MRRGIGARQAAHRPGCALTVLVLGALLVQPMFPLVGPARGGPFDGLFQGYRVDDAPFDLVALDAPVGLAMPIDNMTAQLDLGFETRLFNDPTVNFWVGSNGFISVFKKEDPGCCAGQSMPSGTDPDGLVAGFWNHFDPTAGGNISFQTFPSLARSGLPAQAGAVARWLDLPFANGPGTATFEVIVLADGAFEVQVDHATAPAGVDATIGAESFDGSRGVQVAHGALDVQHTAWRLTPIYEPLVPDLVIDNVKVNPPTLPTDAWTVKVHVLNNGTGNFIQAKVRLTATPLPGLLRGTSPGCTVLIDEKQLFEVDPGQDLNVTFRWAPPIDPSNPGAPHIGDYRFDATGTVLQSTEAERDTSNNEASAVGTFLIKNEGGTDVLCTRVLGIPGIGQARTHDGGP